MLQNADPSNERPNSGLREGDIAHAEVNAVLQGAEKTIIFGQQTRLRAGLLMKEDERLPRYHAGHEIVRFFYGAIRLIPEYLIDAIFERGISVTLIAGLDLLVYRDPRCHQSFHTGRTRKTIYIPEGILMAAFERGYDHWALSEVLIQEAWKLLDYYLIVELVRHCQQRLHQKTSLGYFFIKDTLLQLNKHRRIAGEYERTLRHRFRKGSKRGQRRQNKKFEEYDTASTDTEFMQFYRHYYWDFYGWSRKIRERDPYEVANEAYDEFRESAWATLKVDSIKHAFGYPAEYQVDRDIVHPVAFAAAERCGQPLDPITVENLIHDLRDVARFGVLRQTRTDRLLDQLAAAGLPGIEEFFGAIAEEHATGKHYITAVERDGYDPVEAFKGKIQALSTTGPEGTPNSVSNDFRDYLATRLLEQIRKEFETFQSLPKRDRIESRAYLVALTLKGLSLARPDLDEEAKAEMVAPPVHDFGPNYHVRKLSELAEGLLLRQSPEREQDLLFDMLRKMDRHPDYHDLLLQQARELRGDPNLSWGGSVRGLVNDLRGLIPEGAYTLSSDPSGVRARLNRFEHVRKLKPDSEDLLGYLAGILIRLDGVPDYDGLVERVIAIGKPAVQALVETAEQVNSRDAQRQKIHSATIRALEQVSETTRDE